MRFKAVIFLLTLVTVSGGCSSGSMEWLDGETATGPVWPEAPAPPRIHYLGSIDNANAAGLGGGVIQRVAETVLGKKPRQLIRPSAVVVVGNGDFIVIADPGARAIHVIQPTRGNWRIIRGTKEVPLLSPVGLAVDGLNGVWITDSGIGNVLHLDLESGRLKTMLEPDVVRQPVGIAVTGSDRLVVVDTSRHQLVWLTRQGDLIGYEGKRGDGPGEFNFPTMVATGLNGELMVADTLNFRIQFRRSDGVWTRSVGGVGDGTGYLARPKGLGIDQHGNLYVAGGYYSNLSIFDYFSGDFNLSIGRVGTAPGEFRLPIGLFLDDEDRLFVADSQNARVQVFQYVDVN